MFTTRGKEHLGEALSSGKIYNKEMIIHLAIMTDVRMLLKVLFS